MTELQVLVTTHNEEKNLPDCLSSVAGWTGRILVLDSFSQDGTELIAAEAGAEFVQREYVSPWRRSIWWNLDKRDQFYFLE